MMPRILLHILGVLAALAWLALWLWLMIVMGLPLA